MDLHGVDEEREGDGGQHAQSVVNALAAVFPVDLAEVSDGVSEAEGEDEVDHEVDWSVADGRHEEGHEHQSDRDDSGHDGDSPPCLDEITQPIPVKDEGRPGQNNQEFKGEEPVKGPQVTDLVQSVFEGGLVV